MKDSYRSAVEVFTATIESFLFNWKTRFRPDREELLAMSEVFYTLAEKLKNEVSSSDG